MRLYSTSSLKVIKDIKNCKDILVTSILEFLVSKPLVKCILQCVRGFWSLRFQSSPLHYGPSTPAYKQG